jgi:hypothetical protein
VWTDGLTPADRQAAWDAKSPLWREINRDMLSTLVSELVMLPPDQAMDDLDEHIWPLDILSMARFELTGAPVVLESGI